MRMTIDIYKNKFVQKLINNGTEIFKKDPLTTKDVTDFKKGNLSRDRRRTNPYIRYNGDVFSDLCRVLETLDDLRSVQVFLKQYPHSKTLKKNKITRTNYAIYHIEVYFLKVASLRDKLAILINDVYQVGLPDKRVTVELLTEMRQLKDAKCITLLQKFSQAIDSIVRQRHIVAHKGKYDDRELTELKLYELVQDKIKNMEFLLRLRTRWYVQKKLKTFKHNQMEIEKFIDAFFACLIKEFEARCEVFSDLSASKLNIN